MIVQLIDSAQALPHVGGHVYVVIVMITVPCRSLQHHTNVTPQCYERSRGWKTYPEHFKIALVFDVRPSNDIIMSAEME